MTIDLNYPSFGSSHIDQPKHVQEMTRDEEDELFDATLERDDVAEMVWEAIIDEIDKEHAKEIVNVLFRLNGTRMGDFMEAGRLIHRATFKRVHKIIDDASSETDMSKDDDCSAYKEHRDLSE